MNARERVRAVLNHEIPDRVPNGLGGCETSGMHVLAYDKLQKSLGFEEHPIRMNSFLGNAVFEKPMLHAIDGDILLLASWKLCDSELWGNVENQWKAQKLWGKTFYVPTGVGFHEDQDGNTIWEGKGWFDGLICPKGGYYFDHKEVTDLMEDFAFPDPDDYKPCDTFDEKALRKLEDTAKRLYEETDFSLSIGEGVTNLQVQPGGFVGHMILMMEEPDIMREILDKFVDAALKQLKLLDQAVGKYVDLVSMVQDIGDNRGVTIGTQLWREIYKPAYKKLFQGWRNITDMKCNFHSCGSIAAIMDDLVECGLQVLNPVQTSAADMSIPLLKERYGKDVVFWGGAYDAQTMQTTASYEEVYQEVYKNNQILAEGGNYIFSGVHNLPANIPEHHLKAILDAYKDTRMY